jgi:hypothetical protein
MTVEAESAAASRAGAGSYQDFILLRELAEVYLLLDNLSGSAHRDLEDESSEARKLAEHVGSTNWIEAICHIAWPPHNSPEDQARDVARLIWARDYLNRRAAPANGLTIAFTLLVAGETKFRARERSAHHAAPGAGRGWRGREPPSRMELANLAFPSLWRSARWATAAIVAAPYFLGIWLLLTCCLSWNVATGNALLGQLSSASADVAQVQVQIDAQNGDVLKRSIASSNDQATSASSSPDLGWQPVIAYCSNLPGNPANTPTYYYSFTQMKLCTELKSHISVLKGAIVNLENWSKPWGWLDWFVKDPSNCGATDPANADPRCVQAKTEQWVSSLLGVLGGSVLPIFYGVLGAGAAVIRGLSAKVRDWQLAPRDLQMSLIQLALGAVIGACIGLFVTTQGPLAGVTTSGDTVSAASAQSLLGPLHLSAAALCFVAGFFVEGVFQALEGLMRRVFDIADTTPRPTRDVPGQKGGPVT